MIAYLSGKITQLEPTYVIVECGGIGYFAKISLHTHAQLKGKTQIKLHTFLQIREDAHTLYGFHDIREKELFELLISVSGVGGNTAIMILSSTSPDDFYRAIQQEDVQSLKRIKGIGAKTAARIILELKDKIKTTIGVNIGSGTGVTLHQSKAEALAALQSLGFTKTDAEKRIAKIVQQQGSEIPVADIIKLALRNP